MRSLTEAYVQAAYEALTLGKGRRYLEIDGRKVTISIHKLPWETRRTRYHIAPEYQITTAVRLEGSKTEELDEWIRDQEEGLNALVIPLEGLKPPFKGDWRLSPDDTVNPDAQYQHLKTQEGWRLSVYLLERPRWI